MYLADSTLPTVVPATVLFSESSPFRYCSDLNPGVIGACEDQDDFDLRNQFNTNFLGTLHILHLSLPHFRAQNHGRYLIFSSTAGALGVPGLGPYCATKYAVEGLIESMLYEIDVFNIKATLVEPGHVRLDEPDDQIALFKGAEAGSAGTLCAHALWGRYRGFTRKNEETSVMPSFVATYPPLKNKPWHLGESRGKYLQPYQAPRSIDSALMPLR